MQLPFYSAHAYLQQHCLLYACCATMMCPSIWFCYRPLTGDISCCILTDMHANKTVFVRHVWAIFYILVVSSRMPQICHWSSWKSSSPFVWQGFCCLLSSVVWPGRADPAVPLKYKTHRIHLFDVSSLLFRLETAVLVRPGLFGVFIDWNFKRFTSKFQSLF